MTIKKTPFADEGDEMQLKASEKAEWSIFLYCYKVESTLEICVYYKASLH